MLISVLINVDKRLMVFEKFVWSNSNIFLYNLSVFASKKVNTKIYCNSQPQMEWLSTPNLNNFINFALYKHHVDNYIKRLIIIRN